jgi:hypothetical protein
MLNVVMLTVLFIVTLNGIMPSDIILIVVMLNAVMLGVMVLIKKIY